MKYTSLKRRLLAGAAATAIGVIGAVAMASPASAHETSVEGVAECPPETGEWVIDWAVSNSQDFDGELTEVTVTIDGEVASDPGLTTIVVGAVLPPTGLTDQLTVPGGTESVSLDVVVYWDETKVTKTGSGEVTLEGECAPPASPSPSPEPEEQGLAEAEFDCEVFSLVINNTFSEDLTLFVVPSVGETVEVTVAAGESSEPIEFPASAGLTVDVQIEEGESALVDGVFEIDADEFAANCEDDGQGGDLPVTGTSTTLIAGGAVALLVLGAGLFLVARRRRIRFTA